MSTVEALNRIATASDGLGQAMAAAADSFREFARVSEDARVHAEARLTPVQREEYDTLRVEGVPWLDALVTVTRHGRWFVRRSKVN